MSNSIIPFDIRDVLYSEMMKEQRETDGLLHASSHLVGSLRHAMLEVAGAPQRGEDFADLLNLKVGTMMHEFVATTLLRRGIMVMQEVKLNEYLPEGWGGTPDALYWHPEYRAFVLGDYKTMKAEGLPFVASRGAKEEHVWQTSLYWHALVKAGLPMVKGTAVIYLPKGRSSKPGDFVDLTICEFDPLPEELVMAVCADRWERTSAYLTSLRVYPDGNPRPDGSGLPDPAYWLTDALAPVQERVQAIAWDAKRGIWNVNLVPHWSAAFCRFPDELCGCGSGGQTKIGEYRLTTDDVVYLPRKGQEEIEPTVRPTDIDKRRKATSGSADAAVAPF